MIHGTMIHGYCQRIADPTAASNLGDEPELLAKERAQATRAPAKADKEEQRLEERLKGLNFLLWKLSARRRTLLRAKANMDLMGRSLRRLSRPPSKWEQKLREQLAGDRVWSHPAAATIAGDVERTPISTNGLREFIIEHEKGRRSNAWWKRKHRKALP